MTTIDTNAFALLVEEFADYYRELINFSPCDNGEDTVSDFVELQAWGDDIHARIEASPFTEEGVEEAAVLDT